MSLSRAASLPVSVVEVNRVQSLVAALDLQPVGDAQWIVHVLGVHSDGRDLWIQVAPDDDGAQSIVLRLSRHATARHALATLAALALPSLATSTVVPVMCMCE